jgi:ketosteroid isomerase-like protein
LYFKEMTLDRTILKAQIDRIYAVRKSNDALEAGALFTDDAVFELSGSVGPGRIAVRAERNQDVAALMKTLVETWEWLDHEILDLLIDGNRAAVRYRTKQRFIPTGDVVETDLYDLVTFRDGKISHMVEFCDTALAADLIKAAMASAAARR